MSIFNANEVNALEMLIEESIVQAASQPGGCDPALMQNLTDLILNTLIPQLESGQHTDSEHMAEKLMDMPLKPMEITYTEVDFQKAWDKHATCRNEEDALQGAYDTCAQELDELRVAKHQECNSSSLLQLDDDSATGFDCERKPQQDRPAYLKGVIKKLSLASKELQKLQYETRNCDNATQEYQEKVESCTNMSEDLTNKTAFCENYQVQMEYYSCIHWVWQEEYFGSCDESRHAYIRDVSYIEQRTNYTQHSIDKLWTMLCTLNPNNATYCGGSYSGNFSANYTPAEAPVCEPVTEEHPCTDTWETLVQNSFQKVAACTKCWGIETFAPTEFPTPFPSPGPTPAPTAGPTSVTCDLFEDPAMAPQARVNFLLKVQRTDLASGGPTTAKEIAEEFIRQWEAEQELR
jgi:hypothetical protein